MEVFIVIFANALQWICLQVVTMVGPCDSSSVLERAMKWRIEIQLTYCFFRILDFMHVIGP